MKLEAKGVRVKTVLLVFALVSESGTAFAQLVKSVEAVGMTVSDLDRSIDFFNKVLSFEKVSDVEVQGPEYEKLQAVFGLRMRVARMQLGTEMIELTQYLAPEGRPIPADWRSNDHSFQHIAIVVSDMDKAYQQLRAHKVRHASSGHKPFPQPTKPPRASALFISKIRTATIWRSFIFRRVRAIPVGSRAATSSFWVLITRLSWFHTPR
jgi:catechol 2,3-dioxygenase-like lactoylglutathione lyase family enzyme